MGEEREDCAGSPCRLWAVSPRHERGVYMRAAVDRSRRIGGAFMVGLFIVVVIRWLSSKICGCVFVGFFAECPSDRGKKWFSAPASLAIIPSFLRTQR